MRQALGDFDERSDEFELIGDQREEDYAPPDRRLPKIVLTMLVMAVFAGGLWFAYRLGTRHTAVGGDTLGVPLIRADRTPDKVRPTQPGGMTIPNQNVSIYNEKPGVSPVENLLPPPEKPLPRPEPPPPAPPARPEAMAAPPPPPAAELAPPAVPAALAAPPAPIMAPTEAAAPAVRHPGRIEIRLASVRTPDEARAEWQRLKRDNVDLLGRLRAFAVRADLGDKGVYYRVEAGPFDDVAGAERLCGALKRRNFGCVVVR
ncbi:MAG TPA: SPOR domain-containing protein [Stellaceae bacterium]|nr:SPOR domain-containing protein [Stellaceae bacterium]